MLAEKQRPQIVQSGAAENQVFRNPDLTAPPATATSAELLVWGWPEVLRFVPIKRRTLERAIIARTFPAPAFHLNKRPFWRPDDVHRWAQRGGK